MGTINLKVTLGTVNYTDYLHVTAAKVGNPGLVLWETWIDVPVTNYNFIIPNLDPENYVVNYYDAPTNMALGTLRAQLIVNALSPETAIEKRYYKTNRGLRGDPANGDSIIYDPYFLYGEVTAVFQENFRFLEPLTEWDMTSVFDTEVGDTLSFLNGHTFFEDEVIMVEMKLPVGSVAATDAGSLYAGVVNVTAASYTVSALDKGKRHRLVGTTAAQVLTMPTLASMPEDGFFLFDNGVGGVAVQPRIIFPGVDVVKFNGFNTASSNLDELWVSRGKQLLIAKVQGNWEIILPFEGTNVGERVALQYVGHPNVVIEDGQIGGDALDGDEYPGLWWFLTEVLPADHQVIDDNVVLTSWTHAANAPGKQGLFARHSTLKKFRTPNTQGLSEQALNNFRTYGAATNDGRLYNYPGGKKNESIPEHSHFMFINESSTANTPVNANTRVYTQNETSGINDFKYTMSGGSNKAATVGLTGPSGTPGAKNVVDNIGVIFARRIG